MDTYREALERAAARFGIELAYEDTWGRIHTASDEAIRAALFYARTGIIGAVMLGFGRALGETMAVTMVIGNNPKVSVSLFAPQYTMAAVVANEFAEAADELYLSALVEIGLVLFIITLIINSLSRLLIWSMARSETAGQEPPVAAEAAA